MTERNAEKATIGSGAAHGPQLDFSDVMQQLGNGPGDRSKTNLAGAGDIGGANDHPWCGDPNTILHYSKNEALNAYLNNGFEIVHENTASAAASKDHKKGTLQGTSDSAVMHHVASNEGMVDQAPSNYSPEDHESGRFSQPNEKTKLQRESRDRETGEFLPMSDGSVKDPAPASTPVGHDGIQERGHAAKDAAEDSIEHLLQKKSDELRIPPIPLFYKGDR